MSASQLEAFANNLQHYVYRLVREYELCDQMCMGQYRVTASQGYTILTLPESERITMNALSEAMGLANSTMTRMIDQLVDKGFVRRTADDEDRRVVRVSLTEKGQEIRHNLEEAQQYFFGKVLTEIPQNERHGILQVLERVIAAIEKVRKNGCIP
ncbi:MAG: hypothetical protein A2X25_09450 [Chloroflexi bacterium GWB2_49_20]|nr:MAG: hypothetical protein A2X25_09450 [Chloroflexi bacterium GWB2_49_20]OGN79351.1 MAG: hypothetical protein A2X26_04575 [Chloroflexi bacterium GWC2_49_37]OGN82879.1 MAG: hypothetical protein A2X27_08120 [Chloroflexi bacterium GWD2_49_16]HCC78532.1 hypothetical protein [Anaerolineae bacterium]